MRTNARPYLTALDVACARELRLLTDRLQQPRPVQRPVTVDSLKDRLLRLCGMRSPNQAA